jgi:hypothetical protein
MNDELTGLAVASPSSQSTGTVGGMLPSSPSSRSSLHNEKSICSKRGCECRRFRPSSLLANHVQLFIFFLRTFFLDIYNCTQVHQLHECDGGFFMTMQQGILKKPT